MSIIHLFKIVKHWNLDIMCYWVITACWIKKDLELTPIPSNYSQTSWKLLPLFISINWSGLVAYWVGFNKGMIENTKIVISWKGNTTFLRNRKNINLCLWQNIFKSYGFVVEVTFKQLFFSSPLFKKDY